MIFNDHVAQGRKPAALYLRVPQEFVGDDTGEPIRTWGLNLLVHFPDMTGPRNPLNYGKLGVCAGGCPGEMMISIYNDIGSIAFGPELRFANLENDMHNPAFVNVHYSDVKSTKFTHVVREEHGAVPGVADILYYVEKDQDDTVTFFASCHYATVVHLCEAYGALPKVAGIEVEYDFHIDDIDDWSRIQTRVFEFVQSLVVGAVPYSAVRR